MQTTTPMREQSPPCCRRSDGRSPARACFAPLHPFPLATIDPDPDPDPESESDSLSDPW